MPLKDITQGLSPADIADVLAAIDVIRQKLAPNLMNLSPEERKKINKLGYASEPFAETIMTMAAQHGETIPADIDFAKLKLVHNFRKDLVLIKNNKSDVDELIDDLIMNSGVLLLGSCNRIYSNAQDMARRSDYPFNGMVEVAGVRYQRSAGTGGTPFSINAAAKITIGRVVVGGNFINNGTTVLKFSCGPDLSGKVKHPETFSVLPGDSVKVPTGYHNLVVANMSADTASSFSVKIVL